MAGDKSRWLIMPMEIVERELNGYLLLANKAVNRGWNVLIGTKREIFTHMHAIPKGVVFLKSLTTDDIGNIDKLKAAGHTPVSQDIEGLVYTSMDEFVTVRFNAEAVRKVAQIYFWGDVQCNAVKEAFPDYAERMYSTGSPVADVWHPDMAPLFKERIADIKKRFGRYIVLPSSFGTANHYMGKQGNTNMMKDGNYISDEKERMFFEYWMAYEDHLEKMFQAYLKIVPDIARAFPDHHLIIRPHPSESHESWKKAAQGYNNITVIFEGGVAPWLLGADAVLHWGCTTGIEAYLMGKPVIAYNPATPEEDEKFEHKLPHGISLITRTQEETIQALSDVIANQRAVIAGNAHISAGDKVLRQWVHRYDDEKNAAVRIMDQMEQLDVLQDTYRPFARDNGTVKEQALQFLAQFAGILRPVLAPLPERIRKGIETRAYGRHKTRDIDPALVQHTCDILAQINQSGASQSQQIHKNLFVVKAKS